MSRRTSISRRDLGSPRWALERLEDRTLLSGNVVASVTAAGNLLVVGSAQGNQISIQSTSGGALQVSSLDGTTTINGGAGPFTATGFTGDVDVFMRQGDDVVDVGSTGLLTSLPHNLVIDTGIGADTVAVENTSVGGNLAIFGGAGDDTLTVGGPTPETEVTVGGSVYIVGGTGTSNTIAVFDADITGDLRIFSSGTNDQIQVGFDAGLGIIGDELPAKVIIGGNLDITTPGGAGGCGLDSFGLGMSMGDSWNGCGIESVFSSLLGSRSFSSCDAGKSVANDLAFLKGWCGGEGDFGSCGRGGSSSGIEHVSLADVDVTGNVKINTGNGADQILLGAAPIPSGDTTAPLNLVFGPVTIGGNLKIGSGNGDDTILLDGISVTGNTNVESGKGNDDIAVLGNDGIYTGSFSLSSQSGADKIVFTDGATFMSSVSIKAGRGSDVIWLADDDFQGSVGINGGHGMDTFLQSNSVFPNSFTAGNPVLTSIEVNMPNVDPSDPIITTNFGWLSSLLGV